MPWKECSVMDERTKFIAKLLEGESMSEVCRGFGISRKTGYKIWKRYQEVGLEGLSDRSRRPYQQKNELPIQLQCLILRIKKEKPHWGAIKIRERLARKYPDYPTPAKSTIHALLDKKGFVKKPGCPQQNGRHERIHRTLKKETTKPAAYNFLQQQAKFDAFEEEYNEERPHQALDLKYPAELYQPSTRTYQGLPELSYPTHDLETIVTRCGRICHNGNKINLSRVFASQKVGLKKTEDKLWLVSFMDYDLGYFDEDSKNFEPLEYPFGPKLIE